MKNKIIKIVSTCALAFTFLSGCSNNHSSSKIQIKIGFWPESTEKKDIEMYKQWAEKFEEDNPQYQIVGDPYKYSFETVNAKHVTGSLPTIFQTWFTEPNKLVSKKIIRSIDSEVKALGWDKNMDADMKTALTFNDKLYGIPRDGYGLGLLINLKTFYENGLIEKDDKGNYKLYNDDGTPSYPTTFDEIYECSKTISEYSETKGILICSANKNGGWQFSNMCWNFGATLQSKDANGKWISTLDSDESVQALDWIKQMKEEELLVNNATVVYDDWYNAIESQVAMAIVGSDVLQLAKINGNVNMDDLAFVQMPTGDGTHHYSLYGGTPFVFAANASDKQVEGALKFLEYIGRSPIISDVSKAAMIKGNEVALEKNQPILPTIKPWTNSEYVNYAKELEDKYVSVNMDYYQNFFTSIDQNKHSEVENGAQEMYKYLDEAIQSVLTNPYSCNTKALLTSANAKMQQYLDSNGNK